MWCHNPEGLDPEPVVSLLPERCLGCEACVPACPQGLTGRLDLSVPSQAPGHRCVRCGACADACPAGARTLVGKSYTIDALLQELEKDAVFYDESEGGITFSGGEPLAPANLTFLQACLEVCGERGYHRTVDTSGFAPREAILAVAALTDLFLYDLKLMDDTRHQEYVGVGNRIILENLQALSNAGSQIWIRLPLIPGINDHDQNLDATAAFVASLPGTHPVQLLPYHKIGTDKYQRLAMTYGMNGIEQPHGEYMKSRADRLAAHGLDVRVGG
jgi:pyruvate formate lyase activating enzyme